MGISHETYVGPYVRCEFKMVDLTKTKRACTNQEYKRYGKDGYGGHSFCSVCGSPIGDIAYTEQEPSVNQSDLVDDIDQRLTYPGGDGYHRWIEEQSVHIWLPNIDAGIARDGHLEEGVDFALADFPSADLIVLECKQFAEFFAADLATFRERYGESAVSVRWGIIQHYY